jgi:hypothetical protein
MARTTPPRLRAWRLAPLVLVLGACAHEPPPLDPAARADLEKRAVAASDRLMSALMTELSAALAKGGPDEAVRVCGDVAQRITDETAKSEGFTVRRTSLRVRNPANAADGWETSVLQSWESGAPADRTEVVDGPKGRDFRFLRPIRLRSLCVQCHGSPEQIPDAVTAALRGRYPQDRATGFREGDLRGAVSVRIPVPAK